MAEIVTKDTKVISYLIFKGIDFRSHRKDDIGDTEFVFDATSEVETLINEFPLTPYKRYMDVYKTVLGVIKNG